MAGYNKYQKYLAADCFMPLGWKNHRKSNNHRFIPDVDTEPDVGQNPITGSAVVPVTAHRGYPCPYRMLAGSQYRVCACGGRFKFEACQEDDAEPGVPKTECAELVNAYARLGPELENTPGYFGSIYYHSAHSLFNENEDEDEVMSRDEQRELMVKAGIPLRETSEGETEKAFVHPIKGLCNAHVIVSLSSSYQSAFMSQNGNRGLCVFAVMLKPEGFDTVKAAVAAIDINGKLGWVHEGDKVLLVEASLDRLPRGEGPFTMGDKLFEDPDTEMFDFLNKQHNLGEPIEWRDPKWHACMGLPKPREETSDLETENEDDEVEEEDWDTDYMTDPEENSDTETETETPRKRSRTEESSSEDDDDEVFLPVKKSKC